MSVERAGTILLEEVRKITNPLAQQKCLSQIRSGDLTNPLAKSVWEAVKSRLEDEGIVVEMVTEH